MLFNEIMVSSPVKVETEGAVIVSAANEAARIESMTEELK